MSCSDELRDELIDDRYGRVRAQLLNGQRECWLVRTARRSFEVELVKRYLPDRGLALRKRSAGFETVEALATLCTTSLTATGIRCAEVSDDALAVVISTGSVIDYCFLSDAMKSLPKLSWLRKGTPVPAGTLTARFNADRHRGLAGERDSDEINVMEWLGGSRSARVTEEVVGLGRYGKTLTILSSETIGQELADSDDEEEERLQENWTPRFHR